MASLLNMQFDFTDTISCGIRKFAGGETESEFDAGAAQFSASFDTSSNNVRLDGCGPVELYLSETKVHDCSCTTDGCPEGSFTLTCEPFKEWPGITEGELSCVSLNLLVPF